MSARGRAPQGRREESRETTTSPRHTSEGGLEGGAEHHRSFMLAPSRGIGPLWHSLVAFGALSLSGLVLVTLVAAPPVGAAGHSSARASASAKAPSGVEVVGWGFDEPWAITADAHTPGL